ncbi:MAG: hypothetical protein MHM6MM_006433 [Cercozoa sp. M6MM]
MPSYLTTKREYRNAFYARLLQLLHIRRLMPQHAQEIDGVLSTLTTTHEVDEVVREFDLKATPLVSQLMSGLYFDNDNVFSLALPLSGIDALKYGIWTRGVKPFNRTWPFYSRLHLFHA